MAAPKTLLVSELTPRERELLAQARAASRPASTTRLIAQPAAKQPGAPTDLRHAAPCTYHLTEPEHGQTEVFEPRTDPVSARGLRAEDHRREAERQLLRKDYVAALDAMQMALRVEASARNEALYAWILHLGTSGDAGRVHPRAWHHVDSAIHRDPGCEDAHFYRAMLLKHVGRNEDAYQAFKRVLRINGNRQEAQREVRLFEMRQRPRTSSGFVERVLGRKPT